MDWKQEIGFILELSFFILTGYFLGTIKPLLSLIFFILGITLAIYVGRIIEREAIKKYIKEHETN